MHFFPYRWSEACGFSRGQTELEEVASNCVRGEVSRYWKVPGRLPACFPL
jgi:hypothetical protein